MAKKSYQKGWIRPKGKKWYGYYEVKRLNPETGKQEWRTAAPIALGLRSQMTKFQARDALATEIAHGIGTTPQPQADMKVITFGWFVRNRWLPLKQANWKEETARDKKCIIQKDLIEKFESVPLEHFDKFTLQIHLNDLAKTRSRDRVLQIRAYMRDIFAEAVDQNFLPKDPARKVEVPKQLPDTDTTVLNWDQLRSVLAGLSLKDRLILELDMTDALRPSELFGLRWCGFNYDECLLELRETVYRGKLRNWGKTRKALRPVHIPKELADDLWLWKQESKHSEPEDFIFPNRLRKGGFIDPQNYRRKMRKLGKELGLPKLTFQVIRRTIATLGQKKGTPKDIQGVLRHSRLSTTT
ncbi:MAG TPA: tyrosine-type recombinase/integrase, partial [Terriglobales bacterium]|nr:tyrosine-type recombinase/integrase [Terriglobales bacterium]